MLEPGGMNMPRFGLANTLYFFQACGRFGNDGERIGTERRDQSPGQLGADTGNRFPRRQW